MDFNILKVKGFNVLIYALIGLQLAMVISIAMILISALSDLHVAATVSMTAMFLFGLPMLILLYISSTDKTLKTIFLGLTANIAFLSAAGIIWYILSDALSSGWLVHIAKAIMVVGYAPLVYALYVVYRAERNKLNRYTRIFIIFVNLSCSLVLFFYILMHLRASDPFDIVSYMLYTLSDIAILTLSIMLIMIHSSTRHRYIVSIIFCFILLSLGGDSLNLIGALQVEAYGLPDYADYFYDAMLLFLVAALLVYSLYKDMNITTVEEVDKKLHDTRHVMDDFIMQSPDATCIYDHDGNVVMANDLFLQMFDITRERLTSSFNLFMHAAALNCDLKEYVDQLKNGKTFVLDKVKLKLRNGRALNIALKAFPMYMSDGSISRYATVVEDITDRVRAEEELLQAKTQAELYMDLMGHDINNMNQVGMGYLEIALDTIEVKDDNKKLLLKPLEAMVNSSRLIDNVKKLRRANEGDMYLRPMDLNKLLKDVIAEHGQAPGKDVSIGYDGGDAMVKANELLKDVFANLVSNAIKHSDRSVHIDIKQDAIEVDGKKYYRVVVEDDGPGIPEVLKPVIFDRILRRSARTGGNGIGLYLVKTLIDNFGGSISVEDRAPGEQKKGARFIVTLPAA